MTASDISGVKAQRGHVVSVLENNFRLDLDASAADLQNNLMASLIGWGLWLIVIEITTRIAVYRRCRGYLGYGPVFLFLGAWLSCVHFMY